MTQVHSKPKGLRKARWTAVLGSIVWVVAAVLWWQNQNPIAMSRSESGLPTKPSAAAREKETQEAVPEAALTDAHIERSKKLALAQLAEAAKSVPDAEMFEGAVIQRPPFVSEFEWDLLQAAAGRSPDQEKELTHLVNKLLFFKKYELWKSFLASERDTATRHTLAREVLTMIPKLVKVLGPEQTQEMTNELLADLNQR